MKKLNAQLLRMTLIVRKIMRNRYINLQELQQTVSDELIFPGMDKINCSDTTLHRDIRALKQEFGIDIRYSNAFRGYEIVDSEKTLDIDCILEPLDILTAFDAETGVPDYIIPETYSHRGTEHLPYLLQAIRGGHPVSFDYHKYSDTMVTHRAINPYAIKEWRGRWYVIGDTGHGRFKTFALDRIDGLHVSAGRFSREKDFDIIAKFKDSYGVYSSEEYPIEDIVLAFDAEDGNYLKSRPIHSSQHIISEKENEVLIGMRLRITPDFIMELLSRSWSVRIISPDSLRMRICEILKSALDRNSF